MHIGYINTSTPKFVSKPSFNKNGITQLLRRRLWSRRFCVGGLSALLSSSVALAGTITLEPSLTDALPTHGTQSVAHAAHSTRGVLRAGQRADIAAGMSGRLTHVNYKAGQSFKSGSILARFDCKRQEAELKALTLAFETRKLRYENARELLLAGANGALEVDITRSEMQQASAERDTIRAAMKACTIYAPYKGTIVSKQASAYETLQAGAPVYSIMKKGETELSLIIPSNWMRWLEPDAAFNFTVDETGDIFSGKIVRFGALVDPVSQTLEVFAEPTSDIGRALAGMSGLAAFDRP